jgi:hypothetical protein
MSAQAGFSFVEAAPETPERSLKPERPDTYSMHARELLGMPEEWRWLRIETLSEVPERHTLIFGAIPDGVVFKSGPRKGQLNLKRRHDERQVVITDSQHRAFCLRWEQKTGSCASCGGSGEGFASWSKTEGTKTNKCGRCGGTGRGPGAASSSPSESGVRG